MGLVLGSLVMALGAVPAGTSAQSLLDRPARLEVDRTPLPEALRRLQEAAALPLVYSPDRVPDRRVSCDCRGQTVGQALARLLAGTGLTFRAAGGQILIVPSPAAEDRSGAILGRVVDARSGAAVNGVLVRLDEGPMIAVGTSGGFSLRDIPPGTHRVELTGLGWEPWSDTRVVVVAGDTLTLLVRLTRRVVSLPEIVVAPGTFGMLESVAPGAVRTITREEIQVQPQLGEDVFRSLTRLAGVTSHDISTRLSVRGSLDREVLVRLDGLELYEPYHLKDLDGVFGIVDLSALSGVELRSGGFGVELGDAGAGVLDMRSATAVGPPRTTASLNISHLSLVSQGGFADDRGSWLVSGRRGSMGLLLDLVGADDRISPQFYDVFGKVAFQPAEDHVLTLHALHAGDAFGIDLEEWDGSTVGNGIEAGRIHADWSSSYGWLTWEAALGPVADSRAQAWVGRVTRFRDGNLQDFGSISAPELADVRDDRSTRVLGLREEVGVELTPDLLLRIGGEALRTEAEYDYEARTRTPALGEDGMVRLEDDSVAVELAPDGRRLAGFASARARLGARLTAEVGIRYDRFSHTDESALSPRIQASLDLAAGTRLQVSAGRYVQSHGLGELHVGDGQRAFAPSERSDLFAVGLEHELPHGSSLRIEAYDRRIRDQGPRFIGLRQELAIFPAQAGDRLEVDPARGRMQGVELFVQGAVAGGWDWSASYALSRARDEVIREPGCSEGPLCLADHWVPRARDQRHALNLQVDYRPNDRWRLAVAWIFHSGWPVTPWGYDAIFLPDGSLFWTLEFGPLRSERLPAYHRLDLRATRSLRIRGGEMELYVDLFNVYDRRNRGSIDYSAGITDGHVVNIRTDGGEELLQFLPMFGLRYRF